MRENSYARSELEAYLNKDGNMDLRWYSTDVTGHKIGREMISTAIEKFGPENVTSVSAKLGKDNFAVYKYGLDSKLSPIKAVQATPLGKAMDYLGYRKVEVVGYDHVVFKR